METAKTLDFHASQLSRAIFHDFVAYYTEFKRIMARARRRFEERDWTGAQADADDRLSLYTSAIDGTARFVEDLLPEAARDPSLWERVRRYDELHPADPSNADLAAAYASAVRRRFVPSEAKDHLGRRKDPPPVPDNRLVERFEGFEGTEAVLRALLAKYPFDVPWADFDAALKRAAIAVEARYRRIGGQRGVESLRPLFFRGDKALIVARVVSGETFVPLALVLSNDDRGLDVADVLIGDDAADALFSPTHSHLHVVTDHHREMMAFLRSLAPELQPPAFYASVGYHNLSKASLLEDHYSRLASGEVFTRAPGVTGTVMLAFEIPSASFVLKIIRDRFLPRRVETSRQKIARRYQFVRHVHRAGRILDSFHFHHVRFERAQFDPALLDELLESAPSTVSLSGNGVIIREMYVQRKVLPLDVFFRDEGPSDRARWIALDLGRLHKELASRNIFTGDVAPNNFGVLTAGGRSMRVVSFDYDGYSRVTDMCFLDPPGAPPWAADDDFYDPEESMVIDEEWDVVPDKFRLTLGVPEAFRRDFDEVHADLYTSSYWISLQGSLRGRPEVVDAFPYAMLARPTS